jgi:hypothetical protein
MTELTPFDEGYVEPVAAPPPPPPAAKAAKAAKVAAEPKPFADAPTRAAADRPARAAKAPAEPIPDVVAADGSLDLDAFRTDFGLSGIPKPAKVEQNFDRDQWGLFYDMPAEDYYADPAPEPSISNSGISVLLGETAADFAWRNPRLNPEAGLEEAKSNAVKRRGDVVHQLALGKGKGFAVGARSWKTWQSGDSKAFKAEAEEAGLVPILPHALEEAKAIAAVVVDRIQRTLQGAEYQTEVAFLYQEMTPHGPIWVRGLMDVWCPDLGIILDPKITPRIYGEKPARHMIDMGWDRQGALYKRAIGTLFPERAGRVRFADLMVRPEAPFVARTVAPEKAWEATSVWQLEDAFERFGKCLYSGEWPGFPDDVEYLPMPTYEAKRREALYTGEPMR